MTAQQETADFRPVRFIERDISVETAPDGTITLHNNVPLAPLPAHIPQLLRDAAARHPERTWLGQRRGAAGAWHELSYGEARAQVDALTQWLLDLDRPGAQVMILSDNSVEAGVLIVAAMQARMPVTPISSAYSLRTADHSKLRSMADLLKPAVLFAQDADAFASALKGIAQPGAAVLAVTGSGATLWGKALATKPTQAVEQSVARIDHDTAAKYLFTSGSTGVPKAVITTQRMLCANLAMTEQLVLRDESQHDIAMEWLPWSHVMAGNYIFNATLFRRGSLYIDEGRPVPGLFDISLRNIAEIMPTEYRNVPIGYALLVAALEKDEALAERFFRQINKLSYAGARLPDDIYERFQALSVRHTGHRIVFVSGYGATETSPSAFYVFWPVERTGLIGLPHPGVTAKLVPLSDGRYEVRVKHIGVTPGYLHNPDETRALFDEDGFVRMGDAAEFVDPADPAEGMVFAGRVSEEFKLMSGTFVRVGTLRTQVIDALAPLVSDVVLAGADRGYVAALAWPAIQPCRAFLGRPDATPAQLAADPVLKAEIARRLARHNARNPASSMAIARAILLEEPPSLGTGEITDKGYVNQRRALAERAASVEALYADPPPAAVIIVPQHQKEG
ncbi:AMP-binding protein [Pararhodobacter sp.]|uniref:AMP-binding protein n=1 Tax=Pararhodobacter sp. TaxID=2127056 RepID=UPI002FE28101